MTSVHGALASTIRAVTDTWDEPLDEIYDIPPLVSALASHVAAVVAEKDAETTERIKTEAIEAIDRAHLSRDPIALVDATMRYWWAQAEDSRRRLGAIAALADEWDGYGHGRYNIHIDDPSCAACKITIAIRAILANPAGAISKHEQEVRAADAAEMMREDVARWVEGATTGSDRRPAFPDAAFTAGSIRCGGYESDALKAVLAARADALTEGRG